MKVKDCLKGRIKLGAEEGSGFIYATTCSKETYFVLDELTKESYKVLQHELEINYKREKNQEDYIKKVKKKYKKDAIKQLQSIQENIKKIKRNIEEFKPILERDVVEVYGSILEDCMIVIMKGCEMGKWWTCKEYERGYIDR